MNVTRNKALSNLQKGHLGSETEIRLASSAAVVIVSFEGHLLIRTSVESDEPVVLAKVNSDMMLRKLYV